MPPPLTTNESSASHLWVVLVRAHRALAEYMEGSIAALGIGLTDFAILEVLLHKGPLPISEIGGRVLLANASMTSAIDRLATRGLVVRASHAEDRRVRIVALTPAGRTLIRKLFAQHLHDIEAVMAELRPVERAQLRRGLKTIGLRARALTAEKETAQP